MAIPPKSAAVTLALQNANQLLVERIDSGLNSNVAQGFPSLTVGYGGSGAGARAAIVTALQNAGWTVVTDDVAQSITIS